MGSRIRRERRSATDLAEHRTANGFATGGSEMSLAGKDFDEDCAETTAFWRVVGVLAMLASAIVSALIIDWLVQVVRGLLR